ncbi:MAG: hypothetical protein U5J97_02825 [Trueperaceae bacterium]|nr:hypothetical protein [Trueperaceae bacterium]
MQVAAVPRLPQHEGDGGRERFGDLGVLVLESVRVAERVEVDDRDHVAAVHDRHAQIGDDVAQARLTLGAAVARHDGGALHPFRIPSDAGRADDPGVGIAVPGSQVLLAEGHVRQGDWVEPDHAGVVEPIVLSNQQAAGLGPGYQIDQLGQEVLRGFVEAELQQAVLHREHALHHARLAVTF